MIRLGQRQICQDQRRFFAMAGLKDHQTVKELVEKTSNRSRDFEKVTRSC
jgi:hypothetical protein